MSDSFTLDKRQLRRAFERAAHSYDSAAALQREVCGRMVERLSLVKLAPQRVLDAGSGTGYAANSLLKKFPRAQLIELDIALGMLLTARGQRPRWRKWLPFSQRRLKLCGDNERMPIRSAAVDLVWSNLAFQWAADLESALSESYRVLRPGGLLMFSTFGPDTLKELRVAFAGVDVAVHVNRFIDMHDIGDLLIRCGFADPVMDMEYFTLTYTQARDVMRELKALGAHNLNAGRRRGLTGTRLWAEVTARYEQLRDRDGRLPATFEVVYGHAWKPLPRTGPGGRPVVEIKSRAAALN
ncbi:MAG: malonyl-ACP O-methyltransferase BioC [Burkholderiales bacterium]